jgi:hypothetical protein
MVLIVYDLLGTIVLQDCQVEKSFAPREGVIDALRRQRELGWKAALFADDEKNLVEEVLLKSGMAGAFTELHSGEDFDEEGLKNLGKLGEENWVVFIGDMTRDLRAAAKYGASMIKILPFSSREDGFSFRIVQDLLEAIILEQFKEFKEEYKLEKVDETPEFLEYAGEGLRLRIYLDRFQAQFY